MAEHGSDVLDLRPRNAQQAVVHTHHLLAHDVAHVLAQQIVHIVDRPGGSILHRHHAVACPAVRDGRKDLFKCLEADALAFLAKEPDDGALAVRAGHAAVRHQLRAGLRAQEAVLLLAREAHDLPEELGHAGHKRRIAHLRRAGSEHGLLALRVEDIHMVRLLVQGDVPDNFHPPLKEGNQLRVDRVDLRAAHV